MTRMPEAWDYLILTASNQRQVATYESQLRLRQEAGHLPRVREWLVVPDRQGKRIGSGGSTLECLLTIVNQEAKRQRLDPAADGAIEAILRGLRILIVHAGGDSRRLPAYGPCGKIFLPVPGECDGALGLTLFDRIVPRFLELPSGAPEQGQVVVTVGDVLLRFDASAVCLTGNGITALGGYASPEEASHHGVFCAGQDGVIRRYLQKPSAEEQAAAGALSRYGKAILDVGIMSFDARAASALLRAFPVEPGAGRQLAWAEPVLATLLSRGVDLYREICCAMGTETTLEDYARSARSSGSPWSEHQLAALYPSLNAMPFHVQVLPDLSFLHFGSTAQLVTSGIALATEERLIAPGITCLLVNNDVQPGGSVAGVDSWVEGCRLQASLLLSGRNVVAGVDVMDPLALPKGAALDVLCGQSRDREPVWFIRCYGVDDDFKTSIEDGATLFGLPVLERIASAGASPEDVWGRDIPCAERTLWNARIFPAQRDRTGYRRWLWMFDVTQGTPDEKQAFVTADRYSAEEVALLADQKAFHSRRAAIRAEKVRSSLGQFFRPESGFSAKDLTLTIEHAEDRVRCVRELLVHAQAHGATEVAGRLEDLVLCRILHSLGSAVIGVARDAERTLEAVLPGLRGALPDQVAEWMRGTCISIEDGITAGEWSARLRSLAFRHMNATILASSPGSCERPRNRLRPDETIWGRGPARIDFGGGWTDTPPYTLEHGGDVTNTAINLNGQPPIHCYCRVIEDPVIRLSSIDGGIHREITELSELLDYRRPEDRFALAKAALALSGFSPQTAGWPDGIRLGDMLKDFGGGVEFTTLVGIPKGSGLGTSSILGAVILAVIRRMLGRPLDQRELFHDVLRLEQALTTGGGWQDQVGGGVGGTKITSTRPGMVPDPRIHYVPSDLIDPRLNGGCSLLYYTGITRLAKGILEQVVGGYLDRDRAILSALTEERIVAQRVSEALSRRDVHEFTRSMNLTWELHKRLCGAVTNAELDSLFERVGPHVLGVRIPGAGSGGFAFLLCKSPEDAAEVRAKLEREPLNDRSRFFDFEVNQKGIEVTTC